MPRNRSAPRGSRASYSPGYLGNRSPRQQAAAQRTGRSASPGGGADGGPKPVPFNRPGYPPAVPMAGMGAGFLGNMATGAALGTGSAFAHRAVDSMMGGNRYQDQPNSIPSDQPSATGALDSMAPGAPAGPCGAQIKMFSDCMSETGGDMEGCQPYFTALQLCRTSMGMQ